MRPREKNKYYTFMVVPHDAAGRHLSLRIPAFVVRYLSIFFLFALSVLSVSVLYSVFLSGKLVHYKVVVETSAQKDRALEKFACETDVIRRELQDILDQNNSLRKVLGLRVEKTKVNIAEEKDDVNQLGLKMFDPKARRVSLTLKSSLEQIKETRLSLDELKQRVDYLRSRLESTPSSWPVYGPIVSSFGYRRYPWRGMHTGIDITASFGYPVRTTASGVVTFTGWRTGYGKVVEVDHGRGFSTLYAHNSRWAVEVGQKVKRGQIVAYVGMTGYTTGPHCHYEIRRNGTPINPVAFLGMGILTASKYF